jgi:hypothetical protein
MQAGERQAQVHQDLGAAAPGHPGHTQAARHRQVPGPARTNVYTSQGPSQVNERVCSVQQPTQLKALCNQFQRSYSNV